MKKLICLCLLLSTLGFGWDGPVDEFMAPEAKKTVAEKLETAPAAFYGTIESRNIYSDMFHLGFDKENPKVFNAFIGWKNFKQNRIEMDLANLPEVYRHTYHQNNRPFWGESASPYFLLIHDVIHVELLYDKAFKKWVKPVPENSKKSIFKMAYVGVDVTRDSLGAQLKQRVLLLPKMYKGNRIFFLDGFTQPLDSITDEALVYPNHLYEKLEPDYAFEDALEKRKKLAKLVADEDYATACDLADFSFVSERSKILLHVLKNDYKFVLDSDSAGRYLDDFSRYRFDDDLDNSLDEKVRRLYQSGAYCDALAKASDVDSAAVCKIVGKIALRKYPPRKRKFDDGFRFVAAADVGRPFFIGDFPDFNPSLYLDFGFNIYVDKWVLGLETAIRKLDAKCDSCGTGDFGAHLVFGYKLFRTLHLESVGFMNLGFSALEVPPYPKTDSEAKYRHERYFGFGAGVYLDALFELGNSDADDDDYNPRRSHLGQFLGARLKLGFNNMNVSDIGHAKGISPYASLGLTWHVGRIY